MTNNKLKYSLLAKKKLQKAVAFSEFIYTFANKYLDISNS